MNELPIGIFDTGVGGLSVLKALETLLPTESFLYFADTPHAPYGNKSLAEITELCKTWSPFFEGKVKLLVLACHTVSVSALPIIQQSLSIPIFDIATTAKTLIAPLSGSILLLGTKRTVDSNFFGIPGLACPRLVLLAEDGDFRSDLHELDPYQSSNPDYILLGCTHFSCLAPQIKAKLPQSLIIDPALDLAHHVRTFLVHHDLEASKKNPTLFYTGLNCQGPYLSGPTKALHHNV